MKKRFGKKEATIAILSLAIVVLIVWIAARPVPSTKGASESVVTLASQISPDGKYMIESYGQSAGITAGGLLSAEGIRIRDVSAKHTVWTIEPGYYKQLFEWSADSRFVAVYYEAREYGETVIVDVQNNKEIALPKLDALRSAWGEEATINDSRPDGYVKPKKWLGNDKLRATFQWNGENDARFEGEFTFNVSTEAIEDFSKIDSAEKEVVANAAKSREALVMDKLVEVINNQDAARLKNLLQATDPDYYQNRMNDKLAEKAMEKINFELDLGTVGYEKVVEDGFYADAVVYRLNGTKNDAAVTIREPIFLSDAGDHYQYRWAYFSYLVFADEYISDYLKWLKVGDANKLAGFLQADDLNVPDATASKLMEMYRLYFGSTDKLQFEYSGPFQYRVSLADGKESHPVSIIFGDGLMGIKDTFMPSIN
ncbi:hypothetical protein [Paenibacillus sp. NPDC058071]|uniref:hypothetical protein n=1 Tax=Paenibacillus sp. NPDC058071 TaxID=3346326 RepID=UPI0036DEAE20